MKQSNILRINKKARVKALWQL